MAGDTLSTCVKIHRKLLGRCIDSRSGLYLQLACQDVITLRELERIRYIEGGLAKNDELLRMLEHGNRASSPETYQIFIEALKDSGQHHIVNFLLQLQVPNSLQLPLSEIEYRKLQINLQYLVANIHLTDGILQWYRFSQDHREAIAHRETNSAKLELLFTEIIPTLSDGDYREFLDVLSNEGYRHVVEVLEKQQVVIPVTATMTEIDGGARQVIELLRHHLGRALRYYLVQSALEVLSMTPGSFVLHVACGCQEDVSSLWNAMLDGRLLADVKKMFDELAPSSADYPWMLSCDERQVADAAGFFDALQSVESTKRPVDAAARFLTALRPVQSTKIDCLPMEMQDEVLMRCVCQMFRRRPLNDRYYTNETEPYVTLSSVCRTFRSRLRRRNIFIRRMIKRLVNGWLCEKMKRISDKLDILVDSSSLGEFAQCLEKERAVRKVRLDHDEELARDASVRPMSGLRRQSSNEALIRTVWKLSYCRQFINAMTDTGQSHLTRLIVGQPKTGVHKLLLETNLPESDDKLARRLAACLKSLRQRQHHHQQQQQQQPETASEMTVDLPIVQTCVDELDPVELLDVHSCEDGLTAYVSCTPVGAENPLFDLHDNKDQERKLQAIFCTVLRHFVGPGSTRRLRVLLLLDETDFHQLTKYRRSSKDRMEINVFNSACKPESEDISAEESLPKTVVHEPDPACRQQVTGIACLSDKLFISYRNSEMLVVRESREPFRLLDTVRISGNCDPHDIVACQNCNHLFISDSKSRCIWRVSALDHHAVQWTTVIRRPRGLSVSSDGSLLVVSEMPDNAVYVFRLADRRLTNVDASLRQASERIDFPDEIDSPHRALRCGDGNVVVSFGGANANEPQGVCLLSPDGHVLCHMTTDVNKPAYIEFDPLGRLLVADDCRNRIVLLVPEEGATGKPTEIRWTQRPLVTGNGDDDSTALTRPCRLCVEYHPDDNVDAECQLFVGLRSGRVFVYSLPVGCHVDDVTSG